MKLYVSYVEGEEGGVCTNGFILSLREIVCWRFVSGLASCGD